MSNGPSRPQLSEAERVELQVAYDVYKTTDPAWLDVIGVERADLLRKQLPDIDDATIGRVAITLAKIVAIDPEFEKVTRMLLCTGLVLTRAEFEEPEAKDADRG